MKSGEYKIKYLYVTDVNLSHSAAYAIIAYICMYLKVYHPKEFMCAWINSYKGKVDKLKICIQEAKRLGIEVKVSKWRNASNMCVLKDGALEVGTQTIKFCNATIAEEFAMIKDNAYNSFTDFIHHLINNTSMNKKQIRILTMLNMFAEFGKNGKLIQVFDLYSERLKNKNLIEKTKLKRLDEIREFELSLEDKGLDIQSQIKAEIEHLGYESTVLPKLPNSVYMITSIDDRGTMKLRMYRLKDGLVEEMKCYKKDLNNNPMFGEYSIIKMTAYKNRDKVKKVNGDWIPTGEKQKCLSSWTVIK